MHLNLSFCYDTHPCNNSTCSTLHTESHTFMYKRSFVNKLEHILHLPGILLPAGERRGIFTAQVCGYLRQHHLQPLCFAGSETPPFFPYTYFVSSLAIV